ncbi:MAG: nucleoid-associated protein [Defluviitaleaceae bacterium]|nr:nucleoid-associated protein [Defluviitaleaceae bacterium]MCL2263449.1 nucleoid-associated protein [Defluviitaleaceae bacterium]
MALKIKNAILHILRNDGPQSAFSEAELDIDSEICEAFITKHVKKLINNPAVRTANFAADSDMYKWLDEYQRGEKFFKETSLVIAEKMDGIMKKYTAIPPCDMLIARVGHNSGEYFAVLLLNYQEVYAHKSQGAENHLKTCVALPFSSGKVEFAALVGLEGAALPLSLTEKAVTIDGNSVLYFSEMFLNCETSLSRKEQAVLIDDITTEFVDEYFKNDPKVSAKIKTAMLEESDDEDGFISMDNVAGRAFEDPDTKVQYISTLRDAGIKEDLPLGERVVKQQFAMHKIKAENGVEIRFPAELAAIEDDLEINTHPDGTVSFLFKNLRIV